MYIKFKAKNVRWQYGSYEFNSRIGYDGIIIELQKIGVLTADIKVTIKEGATVDGIISILIKNEIIKSQSDFKSAMEDYINSNYR